MSNPRAYSYIRMSTDAQIKGDSLRRQLELSELYAQEHGLQLVDTDLRDTGRSFVRCRSLYELG
jgi:DNA invertase Pin-like site-specific DNA recombinase